MLYIFWTIRERQNLPKACFYKISWSWKWPLIGSLLSAPWWSNSAALFWGQLKKNSHFKTVWDEFKVACQKNVVVRFTCRGVIWVLRCLSEKSGSASFCKFQRHKKLVPTYNKTRKGLLFWWWQRAFSSEINCWIIEQIIHMLCVMNVQSMIIT